MMSRALPSPASCCYSRRSPVVSARSSSPPSSPSCSPSSRSGSPQSEPVERLPYQRREIANVRLVVCVELGTTAFVAELQEAIDLAVGAAHAGCKPAAHRRMLGLEPPEVLEAGMVENFLLGEADHHAARDRHAVEAAPLRIDAEVAVVRVLVAQAEVLACLRRVTVDPEFQGRLLGAYQRSRIRARPAQEAVDLRGERVSGLPASRLGAISIPTSPVCALDMWVSWQVVMPAKTGNARSVTSGCHTERCCPVFADARPTTSERLEMKIVVIGGTGLIGSKLVTKLNERGHEAIPA